MPRDYLKKKRLMPLKWWVPGDVSESEIFLALVLCVSAALCIVQDLSGFQKLK